MKRFFWIHFPWWNLNCLGFTIFGKYIDFSLPNTEGWGHNWKRTVRVYWRKGNVRHYLYLPRFEHISSR